MEDFIDRGGWRVVRDADLADLMTRIVGACVRAASPVCQPWKTPDRINLLSQALVHGAGWQAETRDADGYQCRTQKPF